MTRSLALGVALGPSRTGLAIGYRLLNLNGTTQAAFTTTNVVESGGVPGVYLVTAPVSVADAGARVIWGVSGTDYWEYTIDPLTEVNLTTTAQTAVQTAAAAALTAYDPPTKAELDTAQAAIIADTGATETAVLSAISGLNNLSSAQAQTAAAAALTAYDPPTKTELDSAQAAIIADTGATETAVLNAISALGATSVTVVSTVIGGAAEVYESDAWTMQFTLAGVDLTDYDTLIFAVKHTAGQVDDEAMLLVRSDTGLIRINKAAPADAGNGSLIGESASQFSVVVESAETAIGKGGNYTWWLKGIDTDADPDRPRTLASGPFAIKRIGIGATA